MHQQSQAIGTGHAQLPLGVQLASRRVVLSGTQPVANFDYYGCHTWIEGLLPFIEQQAVYDQINFNCDLAAINPTPNPNNALLGSLVLSNLMCPTDPFAGLQDRSAILPSPRPILVKSLGESYAPNGGPMAMVGAGTSSCTIPPWSDGRNCYPDEGGYQN